MYKTPYTYTHLKSLQTGAYNFLLHGQKIAQNGDPGRLSVQNDTAPGAQASKTTRSRSKNEPPIKPFNVNLNRESAYLPLSSTGYIKFIIDRHRMSRTQIAFP